MEAVKITSTIKDKNLMASTNADASAHQNIITVANAHNVWLESLFREQFLTAKEVLLKEKQFAPYFQNLVCGELRKKWSYQLFFKKIFTQLGLVKQKFKKAPEPELNLFAQIILIQSLENYGFNPSALRTWIQSIFFILNWKEDDLIENTLNLVEKLNEIIYFFNTAQIEQVIKTAESFSIVPQQPHEHYLVFLKGYYQGLCLLLNGELKKSVTILHEVELQESVLKPEFLYTQRSEKFITLKMAVLSWLGRIGESQNIWTQYEKKFSQNFPNTRIENTYVSNLLLHSLVIRPHLAIFDLWLTQFKAINSKKQGLENSLFYLWEIFLRIQQYWDYSDKSHEEQSAVRSLLKKCLTKNKSQLKGRYFSGFLTLLKAIDAHFNNNTEEFNLQLMLAENYATIHNNYFLLYWIYQVKINFSPKPKKISSFEMTIFKEICNKIGIKNNYNHLSKNAEEEQTNDFKLNYHSLIFKIFEEKEVKNNDSEWILKSMLDEIIFSSGAEVAFIFKVLNKETQQLMVRRRDRSPTNHTISYPTWVLEKAVETKKIVLQNEWHAIPLLANEELTSVVLIKKLAVSNNQLNYRDFEDYTPLIMGAIYKKNHKVLEKKYQKMKERNQFFSSQFENLPILFMAIEKSGQINFKYGQITKLLGLTEETSSDIFVAFKHHSEILSNINMCIKGVSFHKTIYEGDFVFDGYFANNGENNDNKITVFLINNTFKQQNENLALHHKISEGISKARTEFVSELIPGLLQVLNQVHTHHKEIQSLQRETKNHIYQKALMWLQSYYHQNAEHIDPNFNKVLELLDQFGKQKVSHQERIMGLTIESDNKLKLLSGMLKYESKKDHEGLFNQEVNLKNEVEKKLDLFKSEILKSETQVLKTFGPETNQETVSLSPIKLEYIVGAVIKLLIENARGLNKKDKIIQVEMGYKGFNEIHLAFLGYGRILSTEQLKAIDTQKNPNTEDFFVQALIKCRELAIEMGAKILIEGFSSNAEQNNIKLDYQKISLYFKIVH